MLKIENLNAGYKAMPVVRDISLEVHKGEVVSLIGANGAGKTTLAKALSGLCRCDSGKITFKGFDITNKSTDFIVSKRLIQVPEGRCLFGKMTVFENLIIGYLDKTPRQRNELLLKVFDTFPDLKMKQREPVCNLSGGQQQMVAIGRGLMADPEFIIFDEPSIGLSPVLTQNVLGVIKQINKSGVTVLLVEQNVCDALAIADRAYVLEQGRISISGTADEIMNNEYLKKAYLGM